MKPLFEFRKMSSYKDCLLSLNYLNKVKKIRIQLFLILLSINFLVYFIPYLYNSITFGAFLIVLLVKIVVNTIITFAFLPIIAILVSLLNKYLKRSSKFYGNYYERHSRSKLEYNLLKGYSCMDHSLCFHFQDKKKVLAVCFINKDLIVKGDYDEFLRFIHQKLAESNATQIKL